MERTMNKLVLSTLAVMTAVSICGVQPVDAKSVKPDPTMTMLQMPKNDEISVGNGTTKEINSNFENIECTNHIHTLGLPLSEVERNDLATVPLTRPYALRTDRKSTRLNSSH